MTPLVEDGFKKLLAGDGLGDRAGGLTQLGDAPAVLVGVAVGEIDAGHVEAGGQDGG